MTIVDTHCHTGIHKYEPVEALLFHMERAQVDKGVLIQHAGETDNSYHVECLKAYPDRFASAMVVEPEDDGTRIRNWAAQGIIGIRLPVLSRALGPDPLAQWRTAAELDLVVSAPATPAGLLGDEFGEVLHNFPELSIGCYPFQKDGAFGANIVVRGRDGARINAAMTRLARDLGT